MSDYPSDKFEHQAQVSIQKALDAVDRSAMRNRALTISVIVGVVALAIYFDSAVRSHTASTTTVVVRGVAILAALLSLIAVRLQNTMNKNTQAILRVIAELDSKLKRLS
jgi:hypothetical protein